MNSKTGHDNVPVLKVSGLKLTYADEDLPVLTGVDLKLYPQELRIIVGPSGCGKSTLVSAICGFIPHSIEGMVTGTITINGKDNLNRSIYEIASDISLVQQDPEAQLCTNDVYHELAFALENFLVPEAELKHQVNWVIRELGLKQLRNRPLHLLSGGEKQKVALASVLVLKPKVLVFDEPTANLDPNAAAEFLKLIDRVRKNTKVGILIVDHNPSQYYDIADHILVLNKGKIEHILSSHEYKKFDAQYYQPLFKFSEPPSKSSVMLQNDQARIVANARKLKELNLKPQENEIIRIKDLNFSYGTNHVLKNISVTINRGEFIAIMGDNGSGKTTLVQNIMRLLPPSTGTIFYTFNGLKTKLKITKTTTPELAKKIGFVFQNPNHMLFGNNVWEEVMLGPKNLFKEPNFAVKNAEELLKLGELLKYKDRHPILLSHGEKRRLNLASVLCYDPAVVILDEPFIGQDPENISKILEYLINIILSGKTVIMITHRADIVHRYCTRLLFLKNGEIIIDGEPNHAFKKLTASGEHAYLPLNLASRGVSFSA